MSLDAFGLKNLRCLADTDLVPMRSITVLVGHNSSGKSTFLRAFPLIRQSVEAARDSPILWYHERYVDFGSLKDAANHSLTEPSVTFRFRLRHVIRGDSPVDITMTLAGGEIPHVSAYQTCVEGYDLRWSFDEHGRAPGLSVNGRPLEFGDALSLGGKAYLLPAWQPGEASSVCYQAAPEVIQLAPIDLPVLYLDDCGGEEIISKALACLSPFIIEAADQALARFMSRVAYLAPRRAIAQRAYRIQNLAVHEVDPDGKNLAMFLRSLSPAESESLAAFTGDALGFEATVRTTGNHAEILARRRGSKQLVNLVDVGSGYSQVLPLAALLWASCIRPAMQRRAPASLVAIEQPELHLHPAHQARLARMIAEAMLASRASGEGTKFLVETHSESLLNGIGKLVCEGALRAEDVQIALFDQDEETGQTTVRLAGYHVNGALRDWPCGFLSS